jgi:tetratricopeptide (TPR) repeat protein
MDPNEAETIEMTERSIHDGIRQGTHGLCQDAIKTFDRALATCQTFKGDSSTVRLLVARALGNKGAALGDFERNSEAVKCYDAAILIYKQLAEQSGGPDLVADQAVSVMNKGWALIKLGREEEGFRCHHQALKMRRQLLADGCESVLPDIARSLYNVGWGYLKTERFAKALAALDEAADILQKLIAAGGQGHEEDLAYVLGARADTLMYLGRLQESRDNCDEVCALFTRLALSQDNPRFDRALTTALEARENVVRKLKKGKST